MAAKAESRRRKKNARRGRVAQPSITLGREMIPGVPAFQGGGTITNVPPGQWPSGSLFDIQREAFGPVTAGGDGGDLASRGWTPIEGFPGYFFDEQGELRFLRPPEQPTGGGAGPPQWRPGEFGLQERGLALQEESQALQAEIQRARLELDQQIATQQFDLARQTEARIREMENRRIQLDQESLQLQRELGLGGLDLQRQLGFMGAGLTGRGQDITQRGQDIDALLAQMGLGVQARGQDVTQRGQDIAAQMQGNQQQIQLFEQQRLQAEGRGDLQLARDIEERQRALQRRNAALQQHEAALASAGLGIEAQRGAGGQMGQLAIGLGNIEARRAEFLAEKQANPRDWMTYMAAIGEGQPFLERLRAGQPLVGPSVAGMGDRPVLGTGMDRLVSEITQRRDLPFFEEARGMTRGLAQMGQNVPQAPSLALLQQLGRMPGQGAMPAPIGAPTLTQPDFARVGAPNLRLNLPQSVSPLGPGATLNPTERSTFEQFRQAAPQVPLDVAYGIARRPGDFRRMAGGGQMVTDEPVVGIGMLSGAKKFTLGEPAPGFPFGKPEMMQITPFQQGGSVMAGSFATNPTKKPPLKFGGLAAPTQAATSAAPKAAAPAPIRAPTATAAPAPAVPKPPAPSPVQITINAAGPAAPPPTGMSGGTGEAWDLFRRFAPTGGSGALQVPNPPPSPIGMPTGPGFVWPRPTLQPERPVPRQPVVIPPWMQEPPDLSKLGGAAPAAPAPVTPPTPTGPQMSVGQLIRQLMSGLNARSFHGMLPSQRGLMESIISALGIPPEDFWASVESTFPTGINPGRISMGTNFGSGGTIIAA